MISTCLPTCTLSHSHTQTHSISLSLTFRRTHSDALAYTYILSNSITFKAWGGPVLCFPPYPQKMFRQPKPENSYLFQTCFCGCPYEKKIPKFIFYPPLRALLRHPVQSFWFANGQILSPFILKTDIFSWTKMYG